MHARHFELADNQKWQLKSTCLFEKWDMGTSKGTSVHGIDIVVLNKLTKCAIKILLASTPCSRKSHMISPLNDAVIRLMVQ